MRKIDAHHHLWRYTPDEFAWIDESLLPLRRDFLLDELHRETASASIAGSVVVQARQTVEETDWLLQLASFDPTLLGVVGWLPIASRGFPAVLEAYTAQPFLKGLRHVVQAEAAGFLDTPEFNRGISAMQGTTLAYDLLIKWQQIEECTRFVDRHPEQTFVLDHIGKPGIAAGELKSWRMGIEALARRPNVSCKLSGMVTEADIATWTAAQLSPYFEAVLEAFGPGRLMIGTDWPVLTVACSYAQWWATVEGWIAPLSASEQAAILGGTAAAVYRL